MEEKRYITFVAAQLIAIDTIIAHGRCNWKQIKAAVLAQGYEEPTDWLTQVRGPLQNLIDEGKVLKLNTPEECYTLNTERK